MNINLFGPGRQLPLLTARRARGPGKPEGPTGSGHPSREGLPSPWRGCVSCAHRGCCLLHVGCLQKTMDCLPLEERQPGLSPNPRSGWLATWRGQYDCSHSVPAALVTLSPFQEPHGFQPSCWRDLQCPCEAKELLAADPLTGTPR